MIHLLLQKSGASVSLWYSHILARMLQFNVITIMQMYSYICSTAWMQAPRRNGNAFINTSWSSRKPVNEVVQSKWKLKWHDNFCEMLQCPILWRPVQEFWSVTQRQTEWFKQALCRDVNYLLMNTCINTIMQHRPFEVKSVQACYTKTVVLRVFDRVAALCCKSTWTYVSSFKKYIINIEVDITVPCIVLAIR